MIYGIGTDIIEVARIQQLIENHPASSLDRIYTDTEKKYCEEFGSRKWEHYAARFCVKEAFSKAIGTGLSQGFSFKEVGVVNKEVGQPVLVLEGQMKQKYGHLIAHLTIAHTKEFACASVVLEEI